MAPANPPASKSVKKEVRGSLFQTGLTTSLDGMRMKCNGCSGGGGGSHGTDVDGLILIWMTVIIIIIQFNWSVNRLFVVARHQLDWYEGGTSD